MTVTIIRPKTDGTYLQLVLTGAPTAHQALSDQLDTSWASTNDPSPSNGNDTCLCDTFTLPVGERIDKIRVYIRHSEGYAGVYHANSRTEIYMGGTLHNGTLVHANTPTNDYTEYLINPDTSAAWQASEINAAEFGVYCAFNTHLGIWLDAICYEVWVEVYHTPIAGAAKQYQGDGITFADT